jgi:dihydroorotase
MPYDLLIKGGHVLDPGQGLDGVLDIAITAGKIAAISKDIPVSEARRHIVVKGQRRYVTPGLIDLHTHCAHGLQSPGVNWMAADPDIAGVRSGVTTVVDCGTCGAYNFGVVPTYIAPQAKTRTVWFLNIGSYGLLTQPLHKPRPEVSDPSHIDLDSTIACIEANRDLIKGIKLRLVGTGVDTMGTQMVDMAVEAARSLGLPLMTHIGDLMGQSPKAPELTRYLISKLQPDDIITHVCTGHSGGLLDENKKVITEAWEAKKSGVVMDPAAGRSNWNYQVCRVEAEQGFQPDTISTDLTIPGRATSVYSLTEAMARFMACGYSLSQVVQMTTSNAAKALHLHDRIGAIKLGYDADLTLLDDVTGKWRFVDTSGGAFTGEHALVPVQTVRAGDLIAPEWGPHTWGWLPEEA